jgi:hypothetical protein
MKSNAPVQLFGLIILLFLSNCSKETPGTIGGKDELPKAALSYLADHLQPIDPLSLDGFEIWNMDQLNHYQFIFAGESHGMINNYDLDLAMIRHLNAIGWLDYYTPEMPYSFCWFINRFLETGEESMLDELFKPFRGTLGWTKENREHFIKLFQYNQSLPVTQRIQVVGIEIEHVPENPLWMMNELMPEENIPTAISAHLQALQAMHQTGSVRYSELYGISSQIEEDFKDQAPLYQDFFQQNWPDFQHIIQLTNDSYEAKQLPRDNNRFFEERENIIFRNFQKFYQNSPKSKWYGQWGSRHIHQHPISELQSIAYKLSQDPQSPIPSQVLSILYIYQNSAHLNNNPYRVKQLNSSPFKKEFELLSLGIYTLFSLMEDQSPFQKDLIWLTHSNTPTDGVTTDYFQYLLLVDGAEAARPLE